MPATPGPDEPDSSTDTKPGELEIVRASARIQVDFRALSDEECKRARGLLLDTRRRACTGANLVLRKLRSLDEAALDVFLAEHKRLPHTGKEWPAPEIKNRGYTLIHEAQPELGTAICVATANMAFRRWRTDRWNALVRQLESPPFFKVTLPIEIHKQGCRLHPERQDPGTLEPMGRWILDVALLTGYGNRLSLPLMCKDEHQETILKNCWDGTWKMGQPKLQQDQKSPGKWYVRFSYTRKVAVVEGGKHAAIHRGIHCAVVAVVEGEREAWIYDGYAIEAYLKQIQRRRREYQYDSRGSARDGRGRNYILKPIKRLQDKADNWRRSKNQTIARRLSTWLKKKGVTSYTVEDFTGIRNGEPERVGTSVWERVQEWPYYDLGTRIQSCMQELGIADRLEVDAAFLSQRCPACGHTSPENVNLAQWRFKCGLCKLTRHLDVSACLNVLARGAAKRKGDTALYAELCGHQVFRPKKKRKKTFPKNNPPAP